jgi:hypothetical protein
VRWEAEAARLGHPSFASEGIMQVRSLLGAAGLFGLLICHDAAGGIVGPSRPSRLVTVQANAPCPGLGGSLSFNATVLSDGSTQPFSIPPGEVLVITALDWYIAGAAPLSNLLTAVEIVSPPPAGTSDPFVSVGAMDSSGNGGMTAVLPNGLVVKSGTPLCFGAEFTPLTAASPPPMPVCSGCARVELHGYLTADRERWTANPYLRSGRGGMRAVRVSAHRAGRRKQWQNGSNRPRTTRGKSLHRRRYGRCGELCLSLRSSVRCRRRPDPCW